MKVHNFNAGPAILPESVLKQAAAAAIEFNGSGMSILEISHRSKDFQAVIDEAAALVKEIAGLTDEYKVLFLQGGASTQFGMVPMNLLDTNETAGYVNTGTWAKKHRKKLNSSVMLPNSLPLSLKVILSSQRVTTSPMTLNTCTSPLIILYMALNIMVILPVLYIYNRYEQRYVFQNNGLHAI